jgi:hypothetical protein
MKRSTLPQAGLQINNRCCGMLRDIAGLCREIYGQNMVTGKILTYIIIIIAWIRRISFSGL